MSEREKPLGLDMPFGEALERFIGTDPAELPDNVKLKRRKPPSRLARARKPAEKPE